MGIIRERKKRLRQIASVFVDKEIQRNLCWNGDAPDIDKDAIVESLTTVLENVDQYARRDASNA